MKLAGVSLFVMGRVIRGGWCAAVDMLRAKNSNVFRVT